ncbi:MAG: CheR family methyltransferase [Bryobacteraceae bacterium]
MIGTQQDKASAAGSAITPENFAFLQQQVYRDSGIVLEEGKQYLVEARLAPLVREHGLASVNDLCALLRAVAADGLRRKVVEAMTTNETQFFREPAQYEALRTTLLAELLAARRSSRPLNCWSAAASTGQEAYSLAMMAAEMGLGPSEMQILGTDLAESVLERARQGRYSQLEVNRGLPAAYLVKYFARHGLEWILKDEIRRRVRFLRHDLRDSARHWGPFDLVFCRNVLIYFDTETKRKILRQVREAMSPGGYLLLGAVESILDLENLFERKRVGQAIVYLAR